MNILDEIIQSVRGKLVDTKQRIPAPEVRRAAEDGPGRPSFRAALETAGTSLIAEAKCASPSRGPLRENYDPAELARIYEASGASAISVLTEPDYFRGSPEHLQAVRDAVSLPLLRKDFVVDAYQLWEARAWGASAALLIVAVLEDPMLTDLLAQADGIGLDALVEVHTEQEAERAQAAGAEIIGINNRDLRTFETDLATTGRIARELSPGAIVVSESGIFTREHVQEVEASGARAVLVGEALLVSADPGAKVREIVGEGESA